MSKQLSFLMALLFVFMPLFPALAGETEMVRQMQQLQEQTPGDTRLADSFEKLKANPKDPQIHVELGKIYADRSLFELAIASYRRALGFQSDYAPAHVGLSEVFRKKGMKDWELFEMNEAVRLSPQDPQLRLRLGILYMEPATFDYDQAKKQWKELKKMGSPQAEELGAKMGLNS